LGNGVIHLATLPKTLSHVRCRCRIGNGGSRVDDTPPFHDIPGLPLRQKLLKPISTTKLIDPEARSDELLSSYKLVAKYTPTSIGFLYATNAFDINHPQTLICLARTILPSRLPPRKHKSATVLDWPFTPYHFTGLKQDSFRALRRPPVLFRRARRFIHLPVKYKCLSCVWSCVHNIP
jgi:hypothetical protein